MTWPECANCNDREYDEDGDLCAVCLPQRLAKSEPPRPMSRSSAEWFFGDVVAEAARAQQQRPRPRGVR